MTIGSFSKLCPQKELGNCDFYHVMLPWDSGQCACRATNRQRIDNNVTIYRTFSETWSPEGFQNTDNCCPCFCFLHLVLGSPPRYSTI